MIFEVEKQIKDLGDKLTEEDKAKVQEELDAFKKVRETNDAEQIKAAQENFTQRVYEVFGKIYQQAQAQQPGADGAQYGANPNADGHDDADYEVH